MPLPRLAATRTSSRLAVLATSSTGFGLPLASLPVVRMNAAVPTLLNPLMLWGLAALAVPILIHLLLRQRPRRRDWAAMDWLRAALLAAQRRWKLTNLLLLLLRCLLLLLLALAMTRPSLAGLGSGRRLVILIDATASMGPRDDGPGALASATEALGRSPLPWQEVAVLAVDAGLRVLADADAERAREALASLEAAAVPGGLDRAAEEPWAELLSSRIDADSDLLLISDFRQDGGEAVLSLLGQHAARARRWQVGREGGLGLVSRLGPATDLAPGTAGELALELLGSPQGASLAIDGAAPTPIDLHGSGGQARLPLPPLRSGERHLRLELEGAGLRYDDVFEVLVQVRSEIPALVAGESLGRVGTALEASPRLQLRRVRPTALDGEPLPDGGLLLLQAADPPGAERLRNWVAAGGVLWAPAQVLAALPGLDEDLPDDQALASGGRLRSGHSDLDDSFGRGRLQRLRAWTPGPSAETLLQAGEDPLVVARPLGRGFIVIENLPLDDISEVVDAGTFPIWVQRVATGLSARARAVPQWRAGAAAPQDAVLSRDGREVSVEAGEPLLLEPGLWQRALADSGTEPLIVLPDPDESRLELPQRSGLLRELDRALPQGRGRDLGWSLLIAALLLALVEAAVAAAAGRAYGR